MSRKLNKLSALARFYKKTLFFGSVLVFGISCNKKFDHKDFTATPISQDCPLCDYADSISGNYRGEFYPNYSSNISDTMIIELQHVFYQTNTSLDSTVMYFNMISHFSNGSSKTRTVSIDNDNGMFYNAALSNYLYLESDSLHYNEGTSNYIYGYHTIFHFDGKKLP